MSSKHTENYQLCQWEPEDKVVHGDFNEDNRKIDKAIKAVDVRVDGKADASALTKEINDRASAVSSLQSALNTLQTKVDNKQDASGAVRLEVGSYTGTTDTSGSSGSGSQTITLPFTPKAVLVVPEDGLFSHSYGGHYIYGSLAVTGHSAKYSGQTALSLATNGFRVYTSWGNTTTNHIHLNNKNATYHYIALG